MTLALALALTWTYSPLARASATFLPVLAADYGYQGSCEVCHASLAGGAGTATKPFGLAIQEQGIEGGASDAELRAALQSIGAANVDSDADGFPDVQELEEAGDPNNPAIGPGGASFEPVEYGCLRIAPPRSRHAAWPALCGLLVALLLARSACRHRSPRRGQHR